ncbi:hypothetical protein PF005_g12403 [Phytophthora fragariae]|uniref:Uncharacterized protein n=1 Tax=Phytophthora fragariae TaxID=53985 RepID=A0A6A3U1K1_9STRA|nr:hypothetical protein PF009_g23728 [Phytophthora fragariae]KAE8975661.1 hypothetical protein PF011_g24373 [Phytophthora fragariae]KAE9108963.1 hypothetical protein PF010_g11716 [Phytophthora fragariae]KAE9112422.1 hypothetical protein PF007_g11103 [Phytophthora fragariae]KAE9143715.1 hypothetical protein PF006_g11286 [Phytophthora fragariae]
MNAWPGENDTRGNLVYAKLHDQPEKFEKAAFIALGSLRLCGGDRAASALPNRRSHGRSSAESALEDGYAPR